MANVKLGKKILIPSISMFIGVISTFLPARFAVELGGLEDRKHIASITALENAFNNRQAKECFTTKFLDYLVDFSSLHEVVAIAVDVSGVGLGNSFSTLHRFAILFLLK